MCEGDPPTDDEQRRDFAVHHVGYEFIHAKSGDLPAYRISDAIYFLQSAFGLNSELMISPKQRDWLLETVVQVTPTAVELFGTTQEAMLALKGMDATAGLIHLWAEARDKRAARHHHVFQDLTAYARWLRNACHNLSLLDEIEQRASQRTGQIVEELKRGALSVCG